MESKNKTFEICVGIGLNQFFPEYITFEISAEEESVVEPVKKRGRKPKNKQNQYEKK